MKFRCSTLAIGALVIGLSACGNSTTDPGDGMDQPQREILTSPSFATNINEIIQRRGCSAGSCHGASAGQAGLQFGTLAAANFAQIVNVPATSEAFIRVVPNDADNSYLIIKLEGRQMAGQRMPLGQSALDNIDLTNIRNWINNGAPNN